MGGEGAVEEGEVGGRGGSQGGRSGGRGGSRGGRSGPTAFMVCGGYYWRQWQAAVNNFPVLQPGYIVTKILAGRS